MMLEQTQASPEQLRAAVNREFTRERSKRYRDIILSVLTPVLLLVLWELGAQLGWFDARLFSPPSVIFATGATMIADGTLWDDVLPTVFRLLAGFALAAVFGVLAGLLMGVWRPVRAALGPLFTVLYAVPKVALLPLFLLIFGLNEIPRVFVVFIAVFFIVQINTLAGIVGVDARILESARAYNATGPKLFWYVLLPGALPSIFTGLRVAAGLAIVVVVSVEFVAANNGLGFLIWNSWQLFQPATMYVGLIAVSIIGALTTGLIILADRLVLPWKYSNKPSRKRNR
ncbi:MAG: ABC transporter permease [Actinomycetota bacterium]|nr:ABC transporter permease [Actinomycetota bacterium]